MCAVAESGTNGVEDDLYTDEDEDGLDIFEHSHKGRGKRRLDMTATSTGPFMDQTRYSRFYCYCQICLALRNSTADR